jgi:pyruvate,orthophosphate dikinase
MILSSSLEEREKALKELFPFVKNDVKSTMKAMKGCSVTIRLLDPPLHEFVPHSADQQKELAKAIGITLADLQKRSEALKESNPMMGHRGVRLGITYPEVTRMQACAIFEAACELAKEGIKCKPEIMVPVVCDPKELQNQKAIISQAAEEVAKKFKVYATNPPAKYLLNFSTYPWELDRKVGFYALYHDNIPLSSHSDFRARIYTERPRFSRRVSL